MPQRKNHSLANIIEQGIAIDAAKGAAHAWVFLLFHAVPQHLAARVLARSARRRADRSAVVNVAPPSSEAPAAEQ